MQAGDEAALLLAGCTLFAVGSAVVTGWGRARFGAFGIAEANSSRYTIFSAFLVYGAVGYLVALAACRELAALVPSSQKVRRAAAATASVGLAAFLALAALAYANGVAVYRDADHWNAMLADAYALGGHVSGLDHDIYPDAAYAEKAKATMLRLRLGPYRDLATVGVSTPHIADRSTYRGPLELAPAVPVSEDFAAARRLLMAVSVSTITWGTAPSGRMVWRLVDAKTERRLATGTVRVDGVRDWGQMRIDLPGVQVSPGHRYRISFRAPSAISGHLGFPLYRAGESARPALVVAGRRRSGETLHLTAWYVS
jgi:hypothetical protein